MEAKATTGRKRRLLEIPKAKILGQILKGPQRVIEEEISSQNNWAFSGAMTSSRSCKFRNRSKSKKRRPEQISAY